MIGFLLILTSILMLLYGAWLTGYQAGWDEGHAAATRSPQPEGHGGPSPKETP